MELSLCKYHYIDIHQSCSVSKETTDLTATREMLWSDKHWHFCTNLFMNLEEITLVLFRKEQL